MSTGVDVVAETERFKKGRIALRFWLQGRAWHRALEAMDFAQHYHDGLRKSGEQEFSHQVAVASLVRTLEPHLLFPEETIAVAFLHDVVEDKPVSVRSLEVEFGPEVAAAVDAMSKSVGGTKRSPESVRDATAASPIASVVKLADRLHNGYTSVGVHTPTKMLEYATETEDFILPIAKAARRRFPAQEPAYENLSIALYSQLRMLRAIAAS